MKKIESGDGATALNVGDPRRMPGEAPQDVYLSGGILSGDPITNSRLDDLERRIKALEAIQDPRRLALEQARVRE